MLFSPLFLQRIKNRFLDAFLLALFLGLFSSIAYAAISWPSAPAGEVSGGKYSTSLVPTNAILAFNAPTCPNGWKAADGSNGTPDMRGQFLRGINSFDGGATTRADGKQDLDCALRSSGTCSVGSWQDEALNFWGGTIIIPTNTRWHKDWFDAGNGSIFQGFSSWNTPSSGSETRSKNIGVIFCIKN